MNGNPILDLIEASSKEVRSKIGYYQAQVTGIDATTGQVYLQQIDADDALPDEAPYTCIKGFMPEIGDWVMVMQWGRTAVVLGTLQRDALPNKLNFPGGQSVAFGSGDPNGAITAEPGSMYLRTDQTVDPADRFYVKTTLSTAYGWNNLRTIQRSRTKREIVTYAGASTSTSMVSIGFQNTPALLASGGFSNADASTGHFLSQLTSSVSANVASVVAGSNSGVRPDWTPKLSIAIRSPLTITSMRYWAGFFSGSPSASSAPVLHMAAFRFDTGAGDVNFMACTNDNSGGITAVDTGAFFNDNTAYDLGIHLDGTQAVFLINAMEVARITTDLPTATGLLDYGIYLTNLTTSARQLRWGRISIEAEP